MADLRQQLQSILQGRVCLVGVGNVEQGDDGFGVRLAERLGMGDGRWAMGDDFEVVVAGPVPERYLGQLASGAFDTVLFLDAVECGATPGSVVLLDTSDMGARFPQVSTHKLSLGLLAKLIEASGRTKVWLLGVQPQSVQPGAGLSPAVAATLEGLVSLLAVRPEEVTT